MKITEFRQKIKSADPEKLIKLTEEIYKLLPKSKRKDGIDPLIDDILSGEYTKKTIKKDTEIPFDILKNDIITFLHNANNDLYIAPNRIVPKKQRSNWRFEVKNFVKNLDKIPTDSPHAEEVSRLYRDIYVILTKACGYYIFVSDEPFSSVGIEQCAFFEKVALHYFSLGYTRERISDLIELIVSCYTDGNTLTSQVTFTFVSLLKTNDMKELSMDIAKEKIKETEEKIPQKAKQKYDFDYYDMYVKIRHLCEMVLILGILLCEGKDAADYFFKHCPEKNHEVTLYIILHLVDSFEDTDKLWLEIYDDAVKRGIKPRNALIDEYQKIKSKM